MATRGGCVLTCYGSATTPPLTGHEATSRWWTDQLGALLRLLESNFCAFQDLHAAICQACRMAVNEDAREHAPDVKMRDDKRTKFRSHGKKPGPLSWYRCPGIVLLVKKQHVSLDPARLMPVDQPHVSTFRILRGIVLEQASISPNLGFGAPHFSRRALGGVAPKPGRLASHSLRGRISSVDSHSAIGR